MKQKSGILAFILSAIILWILSLGFIPFIEVGFGGTIWVTILIVALVLGIINFIIVAILRRLFKRGSSAFMFIVALVIDAFALWLTARLVSNFSIEFWPHAIIVAAILAAVCSVAGLVK